MSERVAVADRAETSGRQRWVSLDFVVRAISLAMALAQTSGLPDVVEELGAIHTRVVRMRDRA